jgi:phosphonoacetaldehyde hydrolase
MHFLANGHGQMRLKAVVFDWAGTMVDFGSRAPMGVMVEVFRNFGVEISLAEARAPMGKAKRDHIAEILAMPRVALAWHEKHHRSVTKSDIDAIYNAFLPINERIIADYAELVPGAAAVVAALRAQGLKIGSTTGYTRSIMQRLLSLAQKQGYVPDSLVCAGDVPEGRPSPLMLYRTFSELGVYPPACVVKVDDTVPGIEEGIAAGTWTVGVAISGNEVGLSLAEWDALPPEEKESKAHAAQEKLAAAHADYIVDTVADLLPVIAEIEMRIRNGETPEKQRTPPVTYFSSH